MGWTGDPPQIVLEHFKAAFETPERMTALRDWFDNRFMPGSTKYELGEMIAGMLQFPDYANAVFPDLELNASSVVRWARQLDRIVQKQPVDANRLRGAIRKAFRKNHPWNIDLNWKAEQNAFKVVVEEDGPNKTIKIVVEFMGAEQ